MTANQHAVLGLLARGFKLRLRRNVWLLKEPDYVDRFEECPGGAATLQELTGLGYLDERNNITATGLAALESQDALQNPSGSQGPANKS